MPVCLWGAARGYNNQLMPGCMYGQRRRRTIPAGNVRCGAPQAGTAGRPARALAGIGSLPGGTATPESAAAAAERVNDFENTIDRFLAGRLVDPYSGVLKTITPRDPTTGKDLPDIQVIDPVKLRRFRRDFQDVLNMDAMKALNRDLADAEKASTLAISATDGASQRYKNLKDKE